MKRAEALKDVITYLKFGEKVGKLNTKIAMIKDKYIDESIEKVQAELEETIKEFQNWMEEEV